MLYIKLKARGSLVLKSLLNLRLLLSDNHIHLDYLTWYSFCISENASFIQHNMVKSTMCDQS